MKEQISIGEKIRQLREKSKISQKQIAEYLGVDQSRVSKIENNERKPSLELIEKISLLFSCSSDCYESKGGCESQLQLAFRAHEVNHEDFEAISAINRIVFNLRDMKKLLGGAKRGIVT